MSQMMDFIIGLPDQIGIGYNRGKKINISGKISHYVVGGMGGSAIGGDLLKSYLFMLSKIPVDVIRGYYLPSYISDESVVVCSSYSGNTEETISLYEYAKKKKAHLIVITSGGKLEEMTKEDNVPCVIIPKGLPPRCAVGYSLFVQVGIAESLGLISSQENIVEKIAQSLKDYANRVNESSETLPMELAKKLKNKLPIIYADELIGSVAKRWVTQINENSKQLAHYHLFPEMNHNEIVGWENPEIIIKNGVVINLRHSREHSQVSRRFDIVNGILKEKGIEIVDIRFKADEFLEEMMGLLYIGDFLSYYLALENGVDPTPVDIITRLKNELKGE